MNQAQAVIQGSVEASHPSLAGHFPGNPVVPGTLILDKVCSAVENQFPGSTLSEIRKVKFLGPLAVGKPFFIRIASLSHGVDFECVQGEHLIANGTLILACVGPTP
jgi:3-hydroxymyristoyl/3-hydroxydecanoyl-(acyl carrier protein) dehydratase